MDPNKAFRASKVEHMPCNECGEPVPFDRKDKEVYMIYVTRCPHCKAANGYMIKEDGTIV